MKKYKITKKFVTEDIAPICGYSPEHVNLLKRVLRIENNRQVDECLQREKKGYSVEKVEKYDILKAVRYCKTDKKSQELYYLVEDIDLDNLTLSEGFKTYGEARDARKERLENITKEEKDEMVEMLTPLPTTVEPNGTVSQQQETETEPVAETDDEQYNPLDGGLEEDEDIKEIIETYFKGFTFKEYIVFCKALIRTIIGRDLKRKPLDFNRGDDYTKIGSTLVNMLNSKVCYEVFDIEQGNVKALEKAFRTYMWKIRGLNKWQINDIAKTMQEQDEYKAIEEIAKLEWRKKHPTLADEMTTDEALAYIA